MRHVSDDNLSSYLEGDLRPRKSARIRSHLAGCTGCQDRIDALKAVPNLLAGVQFPPISARLSSRIETALAAESSARVASTPASEAGRRELPARGRARRQGPWLPWLMSPIALRTAAAVGAAVVIAGGGYAIISHVGSGSSSTNASVSLPPTNPANLKNGPVVSYQHAGHSHTIKSVKSGTNYQLGTLGPQAERVLAAQQKTTSNGTIHASGSVSTFGSAASSTQPSPSTSPPASTTKLQGCVSRIAAGRTVLLVDAAKYQGSPATIIMVSVTASGRLAQVYAVGPGCSSSASDILAQQALNRS